MKEAKEELTTERVEADKVLDGAKKEGLKDVLVLGIDKDDCLFAASSTGYGPDVLWLVDLFKHKLLNDDYE